MLRLLGYIVDTDISPDMPLLLYGILKVLYISWSKVFIMAMLYHCSSLNALCTAATTLCTSFEIGGLFRFHSRFQVRIFEACLQFEGGRSDDSRGKVPLFDTLPLWLR